MADRDELDVFDTREIPTTGNHAGYTTNWDYNNSQMGLSKDAIKNTFAGKGINLDDNALSNFMTYGNPSDNKNMLSVLSAGNKEPVSYLDAMLGKGTRQDMLGALGTTNIGLNAAGLAMQAFMLPGAMDLQKESLKGARLQNTAAANQVDMMHKQRANMGVA